MPLRYVTDLFRTRPVQACLAGCALALLPAPTVTAAGGDAARSDTRPLVADASTVRVRLLRLSRPRSFTLVADAAVTVRTSADGDVLGQLPAGASASVAVQNGAVTIEGDGRRWQSPTLHLEATAFTVALPTSGRDSRRRYSGTLRLDDDPAASGTLRLVHTTDMESYVAAVVQREYGLGDLEGAKAMAVAARTYALRSRGRFGREYDLVDDIQSQVFFGLQNVSETSKQAARETRGEVLTYRNALVEAVYSASSGGHTAANETIWGTAPVAYLRAHADPYDTAVSPHARWATRVSRSRLLDALTSRLSVPVAGIALTGVGADGRGTGVYAVLENGRQLRLSMSRFRSIVNGTFGGMSLRSSRFTTRQDGDEIVFDGSGFGHGVGLSQWGAHGQAEAGRSYRDILSFYYRGTAIRSADGVAVPLTPPPSVVRPEEEEAAMLDRAFAHLRTPSAGSAATPTTASPTATRPVTTPASTTARPTATSATPTTGRTAAPTTSTRPARTDRPTPPVTASTDQTRPVAAATRERTAASGAARTEPRPADAAPARTSRPTPTAGGGWTGASAARTPTARTGW